MYVGESPTIMFINHEETNVKYWQKNTSAYFWKLMEYEIFQKDWVLGLNLP